MRINWIDFRPEGDDTGDGAAAAWTPPADWPEQFKSPEDLLKSYNELRPQLNKTQTQLEQERQQFAEAITAFEERYSGAQGGGGGNGSNGGAAPGFDPSVAAWAQAIEQGDYGAAMRIQAEQSQKGMLDAVGQVLDQRLKDLQPAIDAQSEAQRRTAITMGEDMVQKQIGPEKYAELLPKVRELIDSRPHYLPATATAEGFRDAILDVVRLADYEGQQQRISEFEKERQEKLASQTMAGTGRVANVATGDAAKAEFERIKSVPGGSYGELMGSR